MFIWIWIWCSAKICFLKKKLLRGISLFMGSWTFFSRKKHVYSKHALVCWNMISYILVDCWQSVSLWIQPPLIRSRSNSCIALCSRCFDSMQDNGNWGCQGRNCKRRGHADSVFGKKSGAVCGFRRISVWLCSFWTPLIDCAPLKILLTLNSQLCHSLVVHLLLRKNPESPLIIVFSI